MLKNKSVAIVFLAITTSLVPIKLIIGTQLIKKINLQESQMSGLIKNFNPPLKGYTLSSSSFGIFQTIWNYLKNIFILGINGARTLWSGVTTVASGLKLLSKPLEYLFSGIKWLIDLLT